MSRECACSVQNIDQIMIRLEYNAKISACIKVVYVKD